MKSQIPLNPSQVSGSRIRRFLLPVTIVLIIILVWLVEEAQLSGFIDTRYDSVILVILLVLIYAPLLLFYTDRINQAEAKIIRLNHLYATLSQVNQTIVRVRDRDELYRSMCDVSMQFGKFALAWVGLLEEATGEVRPVVANGLDVNAWPFPIVNVHTGTMKAGLVATALRASKVVTSEDLQTDQRLESLQGKFQNLGYHSAAAIPFQLRGRTIGCLSLISDQARFFTDPEEVHLLEEMGVDISFALDLMETERERKQAEVRLYESEERFSKAFYQSPIAITLVDMTGFTIHDVNDAFLKLTNLQREQLIGQNASQLNVLIDPEVRTGIARELQEHGTYQNKEARIQLRNGEMRDMLTSGALVTLGGKPHSLSLMQDITERKQTEQQLRQSEEKFSKAFSSSPTALMITRLADGKYLELNKAYTSIIGYDRAELMGRSSTEFNIYTNPDQRNEIVSQLRANGSLYNYEATIQNKLGELRTVLASLERINFNEEACILCTLIDITERKQAEEKLQHQNQRLKVLREIDTAILAADSLENIVGVALSHIRELIDCQRANLALIEWEKNEAVNFDVQDVKESAISKGARVSLDLIQDVLQILSRNQPITIDDLTTLPDPLPQIKIFIQEGLRSRCILPLFSQGNLIGSFTLSSNIPGYFDEEKINLGREVANQVAIAISQNRLLRDLRTLNAELEQRVSERTLELTHANRAKDEFLASMSHELRTPLNTILGLSEILFEQSRGSPNEKQTTAAQLIHSSGQHLLSLINDILEVSKIEAGKLEIQLEVISVPEACEASLNFIKELALKKSIRLEFSSQPHIDKLQADPKRFKQILVNLLSNAVKFTPEKGQVRLEVSTNPERDQIHFSVTDSGIGITPDQMPKLFIPFTQLDSSLARRYEGTGLGLVLVSKFTELHGGSVHVESDGESGKGSRFTVVLPWDKNLSTSLDTDEKVLAPLEPVPETVLPLNHLGLVLLAEDNETNVMLFRDYLQDHGFQVVLAHNGFEALDQAEKLAPNIILMDIQMPEMNGLEAIRRLRAQPRFASTPIIALTALAMTGDRERCLEAGANEYMSKPVSLKKLLHIIHESLKQKE